MIMNKENAMKIIEEIENSKIDVKETIKNAIKADYIGIMNYYVAPVKADNFIPSSIPEEMGLAYDDYANELDQKFYDKVFECLEDTGIYISLAYVEEYGEEELLIKYGDKQKLVYVGHQYYDMTTDFGLKIIKKGDEMDITLGCREGGSCQFPPSFEEFEDDDEYYLLSLNNPLNYEIIGLMYKLIVFE